MCVCVCVCVYVYIYYIYIYIYLLLKALLPACMKYICTARGESQVTNTSLAIGKTEFYIYLS